MRCYLCGSTELTELTRQLRYGTGLVGFCESCRLGMLEQNTEDLQRYYDEDYRKLHGPRVGHATDYDEIFETYVDYQGPRVELLRPHLSSSTRLLDIGCSTGHLLKNLKPLVGEAVGIDYDSGAAAYAGRRVGIETHSGELADSPLARGSFDVVTAVQVMEHAPNPIAFASELKTYLKPAGLLFVEVPNLDDPLLSVYDVEPYHTFFFHQAHLFYFTGPSLTAVMERAGVRGDVAYTQYYNVMNHLHWASLQRPQPDPHAGLSTAALPLRAGLDDAARAEFDAWAAEADVAYKRVLARNGLTDNLSFLGRPA